MASRSRSRWRRPRAATTVQVAYDMVDACERCGGSRAEPGTEVETCGALPGRGPRARGQPDRVRPARARAGLRRLRRRRAACRRCPCTACGGRGRKAVRKTLDVDVPAGIADEQRIRLAGRGHAGERGGPPGDLYVLVRVAEDERFVRDGTDLVTVVDVPAPAAALGTTVTCRRWTATTRSRCRPAPSRAPWSRCAGAGCPRSAGAAAATSRSCST